MNGDYCKIVTMFSVFFSLRFEKLRCSMGKIVFCFCFGRVLVLGVISLTTSQSYSAHFRSVIICARNRFTDSFDTLQFCKFNRVINIDFLYKSYLLEIISIKTQAELYPSTQSLSTQSNVPACQQTSNIWEILESINDALPI